MAVVQPRSRIKVVLPRAAGQGHGPERHVRGTLVPCGLRGCEWEPAAPGRGERLHPVPRSQIQFGFTASPLVGRPGDTIRYALTVTNVGNSTIRNLWIEDALDPRLDFVSSSARVQVTGQSPRNWSFTDIQPNQSETIVLVLRINGNAKARDLISNAFDVRYTNSEGAVVGSSRSDSQDVLVADDPVPLLYIGAGGLPLGLLAAVLLIRRRRVQVEEVFLV